MMNDTIESLWSSRVIFVMLGCMNALVIILMMMIGIGTVCWKEGKSIYIYIYSLLCKSGGCFGGDVVCQILGGVQVDSFKFECCIALLLLLLLLGGSYWLMYTMLTTTTTSS